MKMKLEIWSVCERERKKEPKRLRERGKKREN